MISVVIIMVGLLGLLQAANVAIEHNLKNSMREDAVGIGERQINDLKKAGYGAVITNQYTTIPIRSRGAMKEYRVERNSSTLTANSDRVHVKVKWSFKNVTTSHEVFGVVSQ